ncbi:hypothetical protein [Xenorhabdus bovienii]|nr:hypothetical protein [Xenorhabdus bovienii]
MTSPLPEQMAMAQDYHHGVRVQEINKGIGYLLTADAALCSY